ncbi:RNA polymerase sigma factor [Virgisporangium aurantiacum]|uniref:RNA polymerase sigma factor n=1 Tax=Virgisporangium aurantiacum TaxID=175570 RepID=A0A8J3Z6X1_9ACTN|nr:sigma-70 family RNA polymerase sigma factor [Virgisporangium aurantiacum]GIJ57468.1 RNA polymerase sigma factor [Virgisporangium aurantiacum]
MERVRDYDLTMLIKASINGADDAWDELVRRHARLVAVVIRQYRLRPADAQDVSQIVWLRLIESLEHIREPAALPGWLVTTTRRECQRYAQRGSRTVVVDPATLTSMTAPDAPDAGDALLATERHQVLRDGLAELSPEQQRLIALLSSDPPATYADISRILNIPIGSVGPTRRRVLEKLRQTAAVQSYLRSPTEVKAGGARHVTAELER